MHMKRFLITATLVVLAAGLMSACGKNSKTSAGTTTTAAASGTTLSLVATNFQFDQATLSATAGSATTYKVTNNGTVDHNLTITDNADASHKALVNEDVKPGKSASKALTLAAGSYEYHCEYHPTQMKGTLTVS